MVAVVCSVATLVAGISVAEACSRNAGVIETVYPSDGATIAPEGSFSIAYAPPGGDATGLDEVTLTDNSGNSVDIAKTESHGSGYAGFDVYAPTDPLSPGEYTLEVRIDSENSTPSGAPSEVTRTYTVEESEDATPPAEPTDLELYTVRREGYSDSCTSNEHESEFRFGYTPSDLSDVGYFVATFRESPEDESGGETYQMGLDVSESQLNQDNDTETLSTHLDFEPECITVDVYSPDRTAMASSTTCEREVCAEIDHAEQSTRPAWSELPACGEANGGGDAGMSDAGMEDGGHEDVGTGDAGGFDAGGVDDISGCSQRGSSTPGSLPALLVVGLLGVGWWRMGRR